MIELYPKSPCINVCSLDERGYCMGCHRTLNEIAAWTRLTSEQQWHLLRVLDERRAVGAQAVPINQFGE